VKSYLSLGGVIILITFVLSACVIVPVKPWERDYLAEKQMQLVPDPIEASLEEHTYFSKEAASGGQGLGGGGCGCN
jgi:hypothetical protein